MTIFVDGSAWVALAVRRDRNNLRAKAVLGSSSGLMTTDQVLVETWLFLCNRYHRRAAEQFWERLRTGPGRVEFVTPVDLEAAWAIGASFPDQDFSIVDRTSFAVMERLGVSRAASFDDDFAVYRFGRSRDKSFEILR